MYKLAKYLAIISTWSAVAVIGYQDPLTIVYTAIIALVVTGFILHSNGHSS